MVERRFEPVVRDAFVEVLRGQRGIGRWWPRGATARGWSTCGWSGRRGGRPVLAAGIENAFRACLGLPPLDD